jgi:hypothetical protein
VSSRMSAVLKPFATASTVGALAGAVVWRAVGLTADTVADGTLPGGAEGWDGAVARSGGVGTGGRVAGGDAPDDPPQPATAARSRRTPVPVIRLPSTVGSSQFGPVSRHRMGGPEDDACSHRSATAIAVGEWYAEG